MFENKVQNNDLQSPNVCLGIKNNHVDLSPLFSLLFEIFRVFKDLVQLSLEDLETSAEVCSNGKSLSEKQGNGSFVWNSCKAFEDFEVPALPLPTSDYESTLGTFLSFLGMVTLLRNLFLKVFWAFIPGVLSHYKALGPKRTCC